MTQKKKEPLDVDVPKHHRKRKIKRKPFGIEHYSGWFQEWGPWKWYVSKSQRDIALEALKKKERFGQEYRAVEREP
jgi:hypothetical protein